MALVKVPTNFNIDLEFEIPEFYRRFIALVIDWIIIILYWKVASVIFRSFASSGSIFDEDHWLDMHWLGLILFFMPPLVYHVLLEIAMKGQTIGKRIMGIRVVNETGGRASVSQLLIRWLLREVWFLIILMISMEQQRYGGKREYYTIMMLMVFGYFITDIVLAVSSKKGQRLGDILAKTILIRTNPKADITETIFQEVADSYVPQFPQIMRLSDRDINAIKSILETARRRGDFSMAEGAAAKIRAHLKIESELGAFDFLEVLLKDYNYLSVK